MLCLYMSDDTEENDDKLYEVAVFWGSQSTRNGRRARAGMELLPGMARYDGDASGKLQTDASDFAVATLLTSSSVLRVL